MPRSSTACYIFTTLRYDEDLRHSPENAAAANGVDSPIYLLQHHHERLVDAADAAFDKGTSILTTAKLSDAAHLQRLVETAVKAQDTGGTSCFRVRLQVNEDASVSISLAQVQPLRPGAMFPAKLIAPSVQAITWRAVVDTQPTRTSIATQCKTNDRSDYDRARADAGIASLAAEQEVLLYDDTGSILDASITTPYFLRGSHWITPAASCGGQRGSTRRWALGQGICVEGIVHIDSLQNGEVIWLSNAARGFFCARICTTV